MIRYSHLMRGVPDFGPIPKEHFAYHLLARMAYLGNPKRYATWLDESLNKALKKTTTHASQLSFEPSVLLKMQHVLENLAD